MVESWRFWFIMPENADDLNLGEQPMGTGPFQYKNFVKGDRLELTRFADYWNGNRPYLNELTFRFLADESAQVANFLSGDVDYLHDISVATLPQVEGKRNSKLIPSGLFFQWWQPQMYFGPLKDVKVRQALQWAFDKPTDNKVAWGGRAMPTWNPFERSPYSIGRAWPGGGPTPSYDPERAKSMLAAAGASNLKLNMMILKDPGPWNREAAGAPAGLQEGRHRRDAPGPAGGPVVRPALHEAQPRRHRRQRRLAAVPVGADRELHDEGHAPEEPAEVPEGGDTGPGGCVQHRVLTEERGAVQRRAQGSPAAHADPGGRFHTMIAANQNVAPKRLQGVDSTPIGDQRFDGAYLA